MNSIKVRLAISSSLLLYGCGDSSDSEPKFEDPPAHVQDLGPRVSQPLGSGEEPLAERKPLADRKPLAEKKPLADSTPLTTAEEPVDKPATQALNNKLLGTLLDISREQSVSEENSNKRALEQLSEADRQALIDMTIESSSKKVADDASDLLESLEPSAEQ